jgi:hypothetical protein
MSSNLTSLIKVELQCFLTVPQLKDCCRHLGVLVGGNKPDLQARLRGYPNTEALARVISQQRPHSDLARALRTSSSASAPPQREAPAAQPTSTSWCCTRVLAPAPLAGLSTVTCDRCGASQHCSCLGLSMPGSSAGAREPYTCAVCLGCVLNPFLAPVGSFRAFGSEAHAGVLTAGPVKTKVSNGFPLLTLTQLSFSLSHEQARSIWQPVDGAGRGPRLAALAWVRVTGSRGHDVT